MLRLGFAAAIAFLLQGCGAGASPATTPPADPQTDADMGSRQMAATPSAPETRTVATSGARSDVAEKAPGGSFTTWDGRPVDLGKATKTRGAVVVFYRGHWCKQCRKQLRELEAIRTQLGDRGFDVYAISTDEPRTSAELRRTLGIGFTLLSDVGGMSINAWGVFTKEHELARPAVFVVVPGGEISYRYVSDSPSDRPSPETLLQETAKSRGPE